MTFSVLQSTSPIRSDRPNFCSAHCFDSNACMFESTCAANASCISTRPRSLHAIFARSNAFGTAYAGPIRSCSPGSSAATAYERMNARGSYPRLRAASSLMSTTAAAPSVRGDAFAAVTVPYRLSNTGRSFAICSSVESARIPLSRSIGRPDTGGEIGAISARRRPSSVPACASRWLLSANSSCASRVMPFSLAIFSADCPIVSPVDGSAMAGLTGMRSLGRKVDNNRIRSPADFALLRPTKSSEKRLECRIGTSDRLSAPPAITTSACPRAIWSPPSTMALLDDAHARLTDAAGMLAGNCGSRLTSRARFGASGLGTTCPKYTSSTSWPFRLAR